MGASLLALGLGSITCALDGSLELVVLGRALQGVAIGVVPFVLSILRDVLPPARVPASAATISAMLGIGGAVALPLGAVLIDHQSWCSMFWVSAALGVACLTWCPTRSSVW
ncbi:MFS transporter [Streptomyces sp. NPDC057486]|uniref:MFS transporter n=1 Tax=Streptomyces sp. NPDC057486 TaxID=3346145 RepID=UPI0036A8D80E